MTLASAMQKNGPSQRATTEKWSRLKPVVQDPLEVVGLPSKGDNRLLDHGEQERYFQQLLDRIKAPRVPGQNSSDDDSRLNDSLASLSLAGDTAGPSKRTDSDDDGKPAVVSQLAGLNPKDLSVITSAMRKLREGIVATARTDAFALRAYVFIVRETILIGHVESYHPALLHLLRRMLPAAQPPRSEVDRYLGYYVLDLVCRQADLEAGFELMQRHGLRESNIAALLRALARGDWILYWSARRKLDAYQARLVEASDGRMREHALNCLGATYLSLDKDFVDRVVQQPWIGAIEHSRPGWQLEGSTIIIRRIKRK